MKKLLSIILIALLACAVSYARDLEQGTVEIGGDLDLSLSTTDEDAGGGTRTTDEINISGGALYYLQQNIGAGLILDYEKSDTEGFESTMTFIGPIAAYNFSVNEDAGIKVFGGVGLAFYEDDGGADADGFAVILGGRYCYYLTDSVSLDATLSYTSMSLEDSGADYDSDSISLGVGLSVYIK